MPFLDQFRLHSPAEIACYLWYTFLQLGYMRYQIAAGMRQLQQEIQENQQSGEAILICGSYLHLAPLCTLPTSPTFKTAHISTTQSFISSFPHTYLFPHPILAPTAISIRASNPRPAAAPSQPESPSGSKIKASSRPKTSSKTSRSAPKASRTKSAPRAARRTLPEDDDDIDVPATP